MPSRFEYERAIRDSELPPLSRLLTLTLATWADVKTGVIPARLTPSLSMLESATGMDRSTVRRHLNKLEKDGWVGRDRPAVADARSKKARTQYTITVPKGTVVPESDGYEVGAENTEARGTQPLADAGLGAQDPMTRGTQPLELGAENPMTRGTVPLSSSYGPERSFEDQQASQDSGVVHIGDRPRIPINCQPLVDALSNARMVVGWDLETADWFLVEALIKRCTIPVLVEHAAGMWEGSRTRVRSGSYFLPGWRSLPDVTDQQPTSPRKSGGKGHQPFQLTTDPSAYANGF